jgi:hypothetical protein
MNYSINSRLSIALTVLSIALVACRAKDDPTPTRQLPVSALPTPTTPSASFSPTPRPSASATPAPPSPTPSPWPTLTPFTPEITLEVIGQVGSPASAVAVKDQIAYLGVGPQVLVLDVSDPGAPRQIRQTGILSATVRDVAATDDLLYVAAGQAGLHILDVSDPASPREIGVVPAELAAQQVIVQGDVAFVAESQGYPPDHQDILRLIDVSDPSAPHEITRLKGQVVDVEDGYAFVNQDETLQVIDVSDPQAIQITDTGLQNVSAVADGYAYTIDHSWGNTVITDVLGLVDISNPNRPQEMGSLELEYEMPEVLGSVIAINDSFVYASSTFMGESAYTASILRLVDVSDPAEPRLVASWGWGSESDTPWPHSGTVGDKVLVGGLLYLAVADTYRNNGLWIVDVSDPIRPRQAGTFNVFSNAHDVVGAGEYAYVTNGYFPDYLNLIDLTNLENIKDLGIVLSVRWGQMALIDRYLHLSGYTDTSPEEKIRVLDITDPANPQKLAGTAPELGSLFYIGVADGYACIATINHSLGFFDLTDPSRPRQISQLDAEDIRQVVCAGNYAYYVDTKYNSDFSTTTTLHIVDASDLTTPREVGAINLPEYVRDIALADGYVYVIADCEANCQGGELLVIDVSDEAHPRQVGSLSGVWGDYAADIDLVDHYAYIAAGDVWGVDISDPTEPRPIGYMNTRGYARGIAVMDDTLFVAGGYDGLIIVRVRD